MVQCDSIAQFFERERQDNVGGRVSPLALVTLAAIMMVGASPSWAALGTPASTDIPGLGPVTHDTLSNGMQVLVAPSSTSDLETIDVWVGAGSRRETADNNGVAHFIEHLLFKGTPTRQPGEIDASIEDLGGSFDAATSYDWAHFYVTVASSDTDAALSIISDVVRNAELRQQDMDDERQVILNEMAGNESSPRDRIVDVVNKMVFGEHPYGRPITGTEATVAQMKRDTVLDFYRTYYVPSNVTLVLSGNVSPEDGISMAKKDFGTWSAKPAPSDKTLVPARMTSITEQDLPGAVDRGYLVMGFNAPSVHDLPDAYVMDVLLTLLGQGGNDRLEVDLLRKQKLVSSIDSNYLTQRDPGVLTISAAFAPQDLSRVRSAILGEIEELRDTPVSDSDLSAAKHALLASYLFDVQTTSGRANALGFYNTIDSYQYDTNYIANFEAVTADQLQQVARKYLNPNGYAIVTLMPKTDPQTASLPTDLTTVAHRLEVPAPLGVWSTSTNGGRP